MKQGRAVNGRAAAMTDRGIKLFIERLDALIKAAQSGRAVKRKRDALINQYFITFHCAQIFGEMARDTGKIK